MIRTLNADTFEIDSPQDAAEEILEQLNLEESLLKHSVGIISCAPDFLYSGVVKAICDALPFPVIGATTMLSATNANQGFELLSLFVLTSDDVSFTATLSDALPDISPEDNPDSPTSRTCAAYSAAAAQTGEPVTFVLAYAPFLPYFEGVRMVQAIDAVSGGVPLFGTIGVDISFEDFRDTHTIFNGEHHKDRVAMVLAHGGDVPKFFVIAVSEDSQRKQKGVITEADGSVLKKVNDLTCLDYMASIGLTANNGLEGAITVPYLVDYNDGSPPAGRAMYMFTPEGYAVCGGEMPVNATFTVGQLDPREITTTSGRLMKDIIASGQGQGLLIISCGGRNLALGVEPFAEVELVRELVGDAMPMHMSYSGGEICPVYLDNGQSANRFHNFTLVVCLL